MANWLEKALGRNDAEPVKTVPFRLACQCGRPTEGLRQERAKRVICVQCGAAHFILPANPYPVSERTFFQTDDLGVTTATTPGPKSPPPPTKVDLAAKIESATDADDPFIDPDEAPTEPEMDLVEAAWSTGGSQTSYTDDDLDEDDGDDYELADSDAEIDLSDLQKKPKRRLKREKPPASTGPFSKRSAAQPADLREDKRRTRLELPAASEDRRRQRLRIAAVTALIVVVVGAAITWTVHSRKLDRAEIAMREGRDIGKVALHNRDFVMAREKLGEAVAAMELLGVEEQTRAETRRLWLQAEAGFGLLDSTDVIEIAMVAEEAIARPEGDDKKVDDRDWQRQFRTQFFDRWLCIQLEPAEILPGDDRFGKRVVFPALPVIHLAGVDAVLPGQEGGKLWFAGPIKSCQRDPLDESVWLIEFDSSRVVACDGTESLVRPMLSKEQQAEQLAQSSGAVSPGNTDAAQPEGARDE